VSRRIAATSYVRHYDPARRQHRTWLEAVLKELESRDPDALQEGSPLRKLWTAPGEAPGGSPADAGPALALALPLIREFEGCRLSAYPDPETGGEPWTIGWGTTVYFDGKPVRRGDTISQGLADDLLAGRVERDWRQLRELIPAFRDLSAPQQAALLSFTYNCGPAWFGSEGFTTLTRVLREGQLEQVPAALMLYVNPGGPTEAGLRRRRKAEGALWCSTSRPRKSPAKGPSKSPGKSSAQGAEPARPASTGGASRILTVPYFRQTDSAQLRQRDRTCFSSSCAMLLETLKPGTLSGANGDDAYLAVVQRFGDTTEATAQNQALAHYGITARLVQNADFALIEQQIARGIPVPCGYLHRGPVHRPGGGGHWLIVIGYEQKHVVVHDPWGEPDLLSGATLNGNGRQLRFSRENFGRRWMVEPIGGGAYRHAPGKGWAVVVDSISSASLPG
jgi:GH24 family phage-related lysozyme (muramidase)